MPNTAESHACGHTNRVVHVDSLPGAKHCTLLCSTAKILLPPHSAQHKPLPPTLQNPGVSSKQLCISRSRFSSLPSPQHRKGRMTKQT